MLLLTFSAGASPKVSFVDTRNTGRGNRIGLLDNLAAASEMHNLTLRQLQTLQIVADAGSFSSAAARLGVSQPAISKHIRSLEEKLGFELFVRKRGAPVAITPRCRALLLRVSNVLVGAQEVDEFARRHVRRGKTIRVLAGRYLANYVILPNIARLQVQRPDLTIDLTSLEDPAEAFAPARRKSADLIYVSLLSRRPGDNAECICLSSLAFMASPTHPSARRISSRVPLPMIMGIPGEASGYLILNALAAAKISKYQAAHTVQHPEVMIALARAGEGVCCVIPEMVKGEIANGTLVELKIPRVVLHRCVLRNSKTENDDVRYVDRFVRALIISTS